MSSDVPLAGGGGAPLCSFCSSSPAAVSVETSLVTRPYCLLHLYTTSAIRRGKGGRVKTVGDGSELQRQLPAMQDLFAEAWTGMRGELAEAAARGATRAAARAARRREGRPAGSSASLSSSSNRASLPSAAPDPFGALLGVTPPRAKRKRPGGGSSGGSSPGRRVPPSERPARLGGVGGDQNGIAEDGGFVREVRLPERYVAQQERMRREEKEEGRQRQMQPGSSAGAPAAARPRSRPSLPASRPAEPANPYRRRRGARASIWNLALDPTVAAVASGKGGPDGDGGSGGATGIKCSCGSEEVSLDHSITGRGNDTHKGETWGFKDRSDVVVRYRCGRCGKAWNEEE